MARLSVAATLIRHDERISALEKLANRAITVLEKIFVGVVIGIGVLLIDVIVRLALKAA